MVYLDHCMNLANLYTDLPSHEKHLFASTLATLLYQAKPALAPKAFNLIMGRTTDPNKWFMALVYIRDGSVAVAVKGKAMTDPTDALAAFQRKIARLLWEHIGYNQSRSIRLERGPLGIQVGKGRLCNIAGWQSLAHELARYPVHVDNLKVILSLAISVHTFDFALPTV
jgi:hypothetical protein